MARPRFVSRPFMALKRNLMGKQKEKHLKRTTILVLLGVVIQQCYQCKLNDLDWQYHHHRSSSVQWLLE